MTKFRNTGISLTEEHFLVLDKWSKSTGLTRSQIIRLAIEELAECKLERQGFSWRFSKTRKEGNRSEK
jgi:hypothetical protein